MFGRPDVAEASAPNFQAPRDQSNFGRVPCLQPTDCCRQTLNVTDFLVDANARKSFAGRPSSTVDIDIDSKTLK
jgi:hypothetical protein